MASIAVIGSGFVGQANGKTLARQGHRVFFIDIDPRKLAKLAKENYEVRSYEELLSEQNIDIVFLSVPTPTINNQVDLSFIKKAAEDVGSFLRSRENHLLVVLKSTVPPGTTRKVLIPLLEKYSQKKMLKDFSVAFEPEYLREATSLEDAEKPRVITIGSLFQDEKARAVLTELRNIFQVPIEHVSLEEAEMQKYVHNLFNAAKISFFNEMREVCQKYNLDDRKIFEITAKTAEASWNPNYGIRDYGPFDGSCLPKDTSGFLQFARRTLNMDLPLLDAVIRVNKALEKKNSPLVSVPLHAFERHFHLCPAAIFIIFLWL